MDHGCAFATDNHCNLIVDGCMPCCKRCNWFYWARSCSFITQHVRIIYLEKYSNWKKILMSKFEDVEQLEYEGLHCHTYLFCLICSYFVISGKTLQQCLFLVTSERTRRRLWYGIFMFWQHKKWHQHVKQFYYRGGTLLNLCLRVGRSTRQRLRCPESSGMHANWLLNRETELLVADDVLGDFHVYDPIVMSWTDLSSLTSNPPSPRAYPGFSSVGGKLYVNAGVNGDGDDEESGRQRDSSERRQQYWYRNKSSGFR